MIFCFAIEFLQLYDAMQILEIRGTTLRHSVFRTRFSLERFWVLYSWSCNGIWHGFQFDY